MHGTIPQFPFLYTKKMLDYLTYVWYKYFEYLE
jgi:hypothetical protein